MRPRQPSTLDELWRNFLCASCVIAVITLGAALLVTVIK
jgi:hypothetical protein